MTLKNIEQYKKTIVEDEMKSIVMEYDSGVPISQIIAKHNLSINMTQMGDFLPLIDAEENCPYCNTSMKRKRSRIKNLKNYMSICPLCGHVYRAAPFVCLCDQCNAKKQEVLEKCRSVLKAKIPKERSRFEDLSFSTLCKLLLLYDLTDTTHNFETLKISSHIFDEEYVIYGENYLRDLYQKGVVYIHPNSTAEAFIIDSEKKTFVMDLEKVDFYVNLNFTENDKQNLKKHENILDKYDIKEILRYFMDLIQTDLVDKFIGLLSERGIDSKKILFHLDIYPELIPTYSYTQISYSQFKVARDYGDAITRGIYTKEEVGARALGTVKNYLDTTTAKYGNVYSSKPYYASPILIKHINLILGKSIDLLEKPLMHPEWSQFGHANI